MLLLLGRMRPSHPFDDPEHALGQRSTLFPREQAQDKLGLSNTEEGLVGTLLLMIPDESEGSQVTLYAHMARANLQYG